MITNQLPRSIQYRYVPRSGEKSNNFLHTKQHTLSKMSGKTVFIIGPGFIGWNVLDLLIAEGYQVTGMVRREQHAEGIRKSGAQVVFGDLDNKPLITQHTANSDVRRTNPPIPLIYTTIHPPSLSQHPC